MILGRKLHNLVNWPALQLKAETENCINCKQCTQNCPMSLDVNALVQVLPFHHDLAPIPGTSTILPKHLTIFNGSPRRPKGNTPLMLQQVMKGFSVDEQRFAQPFVEITE